MTAPIQYTVRTPAQAAWVPPQATSADIVVILSDGIKLASLVTGPMTVLVAWSSWEDAQAALAAGVDPRVGIIGWGIERGNPSEPLPTSEAMNIPGWLAQARADCDTYRRQLAVVPDAGYATAFAHPIATLADYNTVQAERYQNNLTKLHQVVDPILAAQHAANPAARTFVMTYPGSAAEGGLSAAQAAWESVKGMAGVYGCALYNGGGDADWAAVQAAIAALRPG